MKDHVVSPWLYITIFLALLVGTALTVFAAYQDMGPMNNVVMLAIALTKALLVVAFFMHLKYSAKIVWLFAGAGLIWFVIMMTFLLGDYKSRTWQYQAQAWEKSAPAPVSAESVAHPAHE